MEARRGWAIWTAGLLLSLTYQASYGENAGNGNDWQQVIRNSPYWVSQGAFKNLVTIRSWVLNGNSFCETPDRHILFDRSATFLGWFSNGASSEQTQSILNAQREHLFKEQRIDQWVPGSNNTPGYPFALSCHQPDAQLAVSLARYMGQEEDARLWGTWDGLRIGEPEQTVSLHETITTVYRTRVKQGRISLPPEVLSTMAGKALIESGGKKHAHSAADARGIMQLSPAALADCRLAEKYHFHRLAQIDCAMRLMEQNHRNLQPVFDTVFSRLPKHKAQDLYSMLLIQAYHGGVGRISSLMTDPQYNGAALYFAEHENRFSAGDMAMGMVFHNLGRNQLGFASLYYVADIEVARRLACEATEQLPGCR